MIQRNDRAYNITQKRSIKYELKTNNYLNPHGDKPENIQTCTTYYVGMNGVYLVWTLPPPHSSPTFDPLPTPIRIFNNLPLARYLYGYFSGKTHMWQRLLFSHSAKCSPFNLHILIKLMP